MDNYIKVHIKCNMQEHGHEDIESLWAIEENDGIYIKNIPFYIYGLSFDDQVNTVIYDEAHYIVGVLKPSEHSTVRVYFWDPSLVKSEVIKLKKLGCDAEISDNPKLIALDIPKEANYKCIKDYLDEGLKNDLWDFEESNLSLHHSKE